MPLQISLPRWPHFEDDELLAVESVLRSGRVNYWTGTKCRDFEAAWSQSLVHASAPPMHSLAMANGSVTLDAALKALNIGPGDEVIVSPRSYVASAMCVVLAGATPVFADIDPESGCITPASCEAVLSPRTRAVIPVHIGGWPCDMPGFVSWARPHGIHIIEDCAQAHGGHINGRPLGTFGTFASWSFCQDKIMTTGGEGGMLCTPDLDLFKRCWALSQHGKDFDESIHPKTTPSTGGFRWVVQHTGTNLRMTEMQAAIGLCQLRKLPGWVAARNRNCAILRDALHGIHQLRTPEPPDGHASYRSVAFSDGATATPRRDAWLLALHADGIPAMHGSCAEVYLEESFRARQIGPGFVARGSLDGEGRLPTARRLGETSLTFLVHHTIDVTTMHRYASAVRQCLTAFGD